MPPFLQNLLALPAKTKALLGVSAVAILAIAFIMLKIATAPSYALIATRPRSRPDGQDHRRARRAGHHLRAAQQRHGAGRPRRRRWRRRGSRSPSQGVAGLGRRHAAGLRAARRDQARRLAVPAAGHLPARAGGRDRQDAARRRGRLEPDRADRDAAGRPLPGRGHAGHRRRHARQLRRHARSPAPCAAWRRSTASSVKGLKTDNVTITDSTGQLLWPSERRPAATAARRHQAGRRGALRPPARDRDQRDARVDARPGQGAGQGQRRPQRRQDHRRRSSRTPTRARR